MADAAVPGARGGAELPPLRQPRAEDAADRDPRLRRGYRATAPSTVQDATETVALEAARLERLVGDLLDLARMNRTDFSVHNSEIDLSEVADDAVRRYQPQADAFGVALSVSADGPAPALADADRVLQVVSNLVENALRLAPPRRRDPPRHRPRAAARRGHGARPEAGGARARVRALLPPRALRPRAAGRHRPRAGDREGADAGDGRDRRGGQRPRRADDVHGAARRAGAPARAPPRRLRRWSPSRTSSAPSASSQGRVHRTPLLRSGTLSETLGIDARFKAELFQRTGSFKVRGALNTLSQLDDEEQAPRRDLHLRRQPRAGGRLGIARGGDRRADRHVAGREPR